MRNWEVGATRIEGFGFFGGFLLAGFDFFPGFDLLVDFMYTVGGKTDDDRRHVVVKWRIKGL